MNKLSKMREIYGFCTFMDSTIIFANKIQEILVLEIRTEQGGSCSVDASISQLDRRM